MSRKFIIDVYDIAYDYVVHLTTVLQKNDPREVATLDQWWSVTSDLCTYAIYGRRNVNTYTLNEIAMVHPDEEDKLYALEYQYTQRLLDRIRCAIGAEYMDRVIRYSFDVDYSLSVDVNEAGDAYRDADILWREEYDAKTQRLS